MQKGYLEIFLLLCILRKQQQQKKQRSIYRKPEFELQRCFTAETKNDIISSF